MATTDKTRITNAAIHDNIRQGEARQGIKRQDTTIYDKTRQDTILQHRTTYGNIEQYTKRQETQDKTHQ